MRAIERPDLHDINLSTYVTPVDDVVDYRDAALDWLYQQPKPGKLTHTEEVILNNILTRFQNVLTIDDITHNEDKILSSNTLFTHLVSIRKKIELAKLPIAIYRVMDRSSYMCFWDVDIGTIVKSRTEPIYNIPDTNIKVRLQAIKIRAENSAIGIYYPFK